MMEIRNIAIIAHVDHGKTTLTDALMRQTGVGAEDVSMDSNELEKERGITIYAKNTAIFYPSASSGRAVTKINIVDTPGHADFGSEVERVLRSIDSVLLVVDAQEGPLPQTRFVLKKSLELGLRPILVINKIDKPAADPEKCEEQVLELFLELGASNNQANFPVVYAIGRDGIAKKNLTDQSKDLSPLLDTILEHVKPASSDELKEKPLRFQSFNLGYDNFLGRLAFARIHEGTAYPGQQVFIKKENGDTRSGRLDKIFVFKGVQRIETESVSAGDIALIAGLSDIDIGETVVGDQNTRPLPAISVDEPTIALNFLVNDSPFAGREGKFVTSRQIMEYLERELESNVGLKVDFNSSGGFLVFGRGELHIAILLENMRRAGYELQVSQPQVIIREENGVKTEPFEEVLVDAPQEYQGVIIEKLGMRGFIMKDIKIESETVRMFFEGPTRGLLGYRNQFIIDTKGEGILSSRFLEFRLLVENMRKRKSGSMVSMATGKALGFSLWNLQERGRLYIKPNVEVYEGMVIGDTSKGEEMRVNPTKGKHMSNMRSSSSDEAIFLVPHYELTIERGLEVMADDEYLEITPQSVRLRKRKSL
ncbi:MAG: GTP-binding protein TypA/BipA [Parcubacteria group bacterium Gr01-1014_2]|nr:MAG: GTP-binding protein TypA/BipA [Parcubacteria group bacterium Gr01-1014_2]